MLTRTKEARITRQMFLMKTPSVKNGLTYFTQQKAKRNEKRSLRNIGKGGESSLLKNQDLKGRNPLFVHFDASFFVVHFAHETRFFRMRPMEKREREHVIPDDVALGRVEIVSKQGIMEGPSRMAKAMEPMPLVLFVPIIKIVIVEQSASHEARIIQVEMAFFRIEIGPLRHEKRMVINAHLPMGAVVFHALIFRLIDERRRDGVEF